MTSISPQDIAAQLPVILSRVARGEEFVVTDNGKARGPNRSASRGGGDAPGI
jgi:hypothetical protein